VGSATSYPPTDFLRSTIGDGGLNFRVRNGTGCAPSSMVTEPAGGLRFGEHPEGPHSAQTDATTIPTRETLVREELGRLVPLA
jgi:hypothetical protein